MALRSRASTAPTFLAAPRSAKHLAFVTDGDVQDLRNFAENEREAIKASH